MPFICFVHIEKAGGITLHTLLHKLFRGYLSPSPVYGEHFTRADLAGLKRLWPFPLHGLGGHRMGAWLGYESVVGQEVFYFTFLRNPLDRYLSHLNWQLHIKRNFTTPEAFVSEAYFDNFQCYRIAGERSEKKARKMLAEQFAFTGLLEEYDLSLLLWCSALGRADLDLRYERQNVKDYGEKSVRREDLPEGLWKKIVEKNAEDLALYQWVREELFPQQVKAYSGNWKADLQAFRQSNEGYRFPFSVHIKRKLTNALLSKVVQPALKRKRPE